VVRCSRQVKLRAGCINSLEITFLTQNSCHKSGVSVYQAPIVNEAEQRRVSTFEGVGKSMRCLFRKDVTVALKELAHDLRLSTHSF
jgi:hypothetical protein